MLGVERQHDFHKISVSAIYLHFGIKITSQNSLQDDPVALKTRPKRLKSAPRRLGDASRAPILASRALQVLSDGVRNHLGSIFNQILIDCGGVLVCFC